MAEEKQRDRGGKANEEAFKAGVTYGVELGKIEAESLRDLAAQIRRETLTKVEAAYKTFQATQKPRRTRRVKGETVPALEES